MTDIVERLSGMANAIGGEDEDFLMEVVAEIEQLRALLEAKTTPGYELLAGTIEDKDNEIEQLREALQRIVQWSDAYPIDIFHEPTTEEYKSAHSALKVVGLTMDAFSASMGRHCLEGVKKIANEALHENY